MAGLLAAVEGYMAADEEQHIAGMEATVAAWIREFGELPGVSASRVFPNIDGQPTPRARVTLDPNVTGISGERLRARLRSETPSIAVGLDGADSILLTADTLRPGEEAVVARRIVEIKGSIDRIKEQVQNVE